MELKKWIIECFFIFLMLGLFLILNNENRVINASEVDYLKNHSIETLQLSNSDLFTYQAFIMSELHGFHDNAEIKYNFLVYLNEKIYLNIYLAEVSFSSGYLLNEYLKTGDEDLLQQVFAFYRGSTFYTKEEVEFYQKIYKYNLTVDDKKKIKVMGIDIEHSYDSSLYFYEYYTGKKINDVNEILNVTEDPILNHLKKNVIASKNFYENVNWQKRDTTMYENYLFLQSYYQFNCFYTQLGAKHVFRDISDDDFKSLAYYLNNDIKSPVNEKVLSIMTFYKDSEFLESYTIKSKSIYKSEKINRSYNMNNLDFFTQNFVLVNLTLPNSPYKENLIWYHQVPNDLDKVTTDYYQYLILINHSKACSPIDDTMKINKFESLINLLKEIF